MADPAYEDTMMEIFGFSVVDYRQEHIEQRQGQASFNVLYQTRRKWSDEIRSTKLDPFFFDDRLPAFRRWLKEKFAQEYATSGQPEGVEP